MARETSKKSWDEYKDSNSRSFCQRLILDILKKHGKLTGREICSKANRDGLWKRLSELRDSGFIAEAGKRVCSVTNRKAIIWEVVEP